MTARLAALVRADARFSFPPRPVWYDASPSHPLGPPAELFEAFGLPMSFPPSGRFNEQEFNAEEVR